MKIKIIFFAALLILFTGCAPTRYYHPSKNAQDFKRDKYECKLISGQSAANWGMQNPYMIQSEMKRCLEFEYGWKVKK